MNSQPFACGRSIVMQLFSLTAFTFCTLSVFTPSLARAVPPTVTSGLSAGQITLVDNSGKTQSAVELKADGTADISATLSYGNERLIPKGTKVSLIRLTAKQQQVAAVTTSESGGEVTFTGVTDGTYKLRVACDEFQVSNVAFGSLPASDDQGFVSEDSRETISIQDTSGVSRAVREVAPGSKNTVIVKSETEGSGFTGIKSRLVVIENNQRTDVAGDSNINKQGEATFKNIPAGTYQVEYDCQNQTEAVSISGKGVLNAICPVTIAG